LQHAESLESRLNQYDELMESIRDSMDKMEGKTGNFETVNLNNKKLLNTLEKIVKQLDLSYTHQQALTEADFR
jgi:archaellum component FlaC